MRVIIFSALVLCTASTQVLAEKQYWLGTDGDYARGIDGKCVRTILWTPENAIDSCEGIEVKAEVKPVPVKEEPVAAKETPEPVTEMKAAEPEYVSLNLASGATFELGGSVLSAEGKAAVVALMVQFEGETVNSVVIEGYTDDRGAAAFNQQLSEKRAEAVKAELVANGANPDKITTVGYGEANPVADNNTRTGRAENRRVEIKVDGEMRKL
jgi:OOP family OmpA-OmpF porin